MARNRAAVWPEDTIECLNAVGTILYTALYRRRAEIGMERLRLLEQTVGKIASEFVHILPERVDAEIENALGQYASVSTPILAPSFNAMTPRV
jgi:hypothetical protein